MQIQENEQGTKAKDDESHQISLKDCNAYKKLRNGHTLGE